MNNKIYFILLILSLCCIVVSSVYIPPGPRYKCPENEKQLFPCKCIKSSDKGLYVTCENTNLAGLALALENIAYLQSPVENLTIFKSHFEKLYGSLFFNVKVRILHLEEIPIKTISDHVFHGVNTTLQEFHIIKSSLNEFPSEAFKILGNLSVLNINYHFIDKLNESILADSQLINRLEKLHLTNGILTDLPVESFQSLRKLKTLDLHGNHLSQLKRNQFKNLRDLEVLDISSNNITKLESHHIADLTKMSWCNVSANALTEISRGTFARNSVLRVLNMASNKISRLDANSFRGMRFLRRLYLSGNNIHDVGRGTFGSITRIGTIDMARNQIKKIDYQMFSQLNYIEIIDVAENQITEIQKQSFKDLYLTSINISHNEISVIEKNAFENCANMTLLDLSFNKIDVIPNNTFDETSYATELQLSFNNLTDLSKIPLKFMTGLKILNISNNNLQVIPKNTFPKLYELHTIDVSHNTISSIDNGVFQPLFSLRNINLSHNSMEEIKSSTFGSLQTLLTLDLSFNKLKQIARSGLAQLSGLRELTLRNNALERLFQIPISLNNLDLSYNLITDIPENTWPVMNALLSLDMTANRIGNNLRGHSFSGLLTLQTLKMNENGLDNIPKESLDGFSTLQYLHLANNNISELKKAAFGRLPTVFEVILHNNTIKNISSNAFEGLLQLLKLNMSNNQISYIPTNAFVGLVSLRELDLSHNWLERLDNKTHGVLDNCLSLEKINLSNNKFNFITRKTFSSDPWIPYKLNNIDLSFNSLAILTYDLTFGTRKVQSLNLSHNSITDIRKYVLGNLTSLETLDLSFNKLVDLESDEVSFKLPKNLSNIYLGNNQINHIPIKEFYNLTRIDMIDLHNNELDEFPVFFANQIKNGSKILYEGNPLNCNCKIRPLKHHLYELTNVPNELSALKCLNPSRIAEKLLIEVTDDQLQCASENLNNTEFRDLYDIQPDLKFREIFYYKENLTLKWFVVSHRDVADTYIYLRNEKNEIYFEKLLPFVARQVDIPAEYISKAIKGSQTVEICVLSKNSLDIIGQWFDSQCVKLPDNFENIIKNYNSKSNSVYTIFTRNPRRKISYTPRANMKTTSTAGRIKFNIIYLIFILFIKI